MTQQKVGHQSRANTAIDQPDTATHSYLAGIQAELNSAAKRFDGVKSVLVVLSAKGMVYDVESLRQKVHLSYPSAAVFFMTPAGTPLGASAPRKVDLVIDFTGPGQRGKWFHSLSLKSSARFAVGRNAGVFRKSLYHRIFDESSREHSGRLPAEALARERLVQLEVLHLAGIPFVQTGDTPHDRGKITPLELPPLQKR